MTYLLLQTFLLLLSAYFLGAFAGCIAKRMVATRRPRFAPVALDIQPIPEGPADAIPLVKPRPIELVQPKIEIVPRPEPKIIPALLDISRFERALTGPDPNEGMPRVMIVEICPAVLEPPTVAAEPAKPMPEPAVEMPEASPEASPDEDLQLDAAVGDAAREDAAVPASHGGAMATAAAAAAATTVSAVRRAGDTAEEKPPEEDSPASDETRAVAAPEPLEAGADEPAYQDDLQSIRAIDAETERRLNDVGVTTFDQIARWSADDIELYSEELSLGGRVDQEQWIEQAQILAKGGDTYYSRSWAAALGGGQEDDTPADSLESASDDEVSEGAPEPEDETVVQPEEELRSEETTEQGSGHTAGAQDASEVAETTAPEGEAQDEPPSASSPSGQSSALAAAAAAAAAFHGMPASMGPSVSDAQSATEEGDVLSSEPSSSSGAAAQGRSVAEMAAAAAAAISAASASVTRGIRPIEPISPLSRANPNIVMPAKLVDAIRERDAQAQASTQSDSAADLKRTTSEGAAAPGPSDDLKRIRGIGVLIERQLNAQGITSYQQIANWSSGDIEAISAKLDFKGRIERENWVEQARILSSGGMTEFSRRVDRGDFDSSHKDETS